jgi:hypothetical protein
MSVPGSDRVRRVRRVLVSVAAAALSVASICVGSVLASPRSANCTGGTHTVAGATIRTFCGPARGSAHAAGKTFTFSGGQCAVSQGFFSVNIGSITLPPAKPKSIYLGIDVKPAQAGAHANQIVSWQVPGTDYSIIGANVTVSPGLGGGSFSGRLATGGTASGSFSCS